MDTVAVHVKQKKAIRYETENKNRHSLKMAVRDGLWLGSGTCSGYWDAMERRSCTSDYWQTAFPHLQVRKNAQER